jgi:hypothetical protein
LSNFGADYYDPVPTYAANQRHIQQVAEKLITECRFENGRIVIRSQDM